MPPFPRPIRWGYVLRLGGTAVTFIVLVLGLVGFGLAWIYSYAVLHPGCQGDRANLAERGFLSEAVSFPSQNGPVLRGWYSRGRTHPDIAIIVVTGHGGNTRFALDDASIVAGAGFSTLIYEHRSCANPALSASTGYYEAYDVLGAVEYLKSRHDVSRIGAWGYSEGGTASLLAASREESIEAVAAMGGYASLKDEILGRNRSVGTLDRVERQFVMWAMDIQLGVPVEASSPIDVISRISPRPLLLIYGEYEADNGQALYDAAGDPKSLWIVPGAGHGGYAAAAPVEYGSRVVAFFDAAFVSRP